MIWAVLPVTLYCFIFYQCILLCHHLLVISLSVLLQCTDNDLHYLNVQSTLLLLYCTLLYFALIFLIKVMMFVTMHCSILLSSWTCLMSLTGWTPISGNLEKQEHLENKLIWKIFLKNLKNVCYCFVSTWKTWKNNFLLCLQLTFLCILANSVVLFLKDVLAWFLVLQNML